MASPEDATTCARAKALIDQAHDTEDDALRERLDREAHQLLAPLVAAGFPEALYLHAHSTLYLEGLDDKAFEERHIALIWGAAHAGHMRAQFRLGQMYEPDAELEANAAASAHWFKLSALQGYPYAQWVHGLNLWTGHGCPRDEVLGLEFIRKAAEGRFEGAIQFVADAYAAGTHGYPKDEAQAETWRRRLDEPGVISY
ncbi:MAG TPA: tetratricopeptide repeat protein [Dongiaceae bacterium]|nr:tetratricopeptide repeat protein [Dongiaceae bacterium]